MENVENIQYTEILEIVRNQMYDLMEENLNYYKDYEVIISLEQEFIKLKNKKPNAIYMVIKFSAAEVTFGQTVLPFTLTALSEANKMGVCQKLLLDYSYRYNLDRLDENNIQQIYEAPLVTSNFNSLYAEYRSVIVMSGVFIVSKRNNYYTFTYGGEEIEYLTSTLNASITLDTQAFYNTKNFTQSVGKFGTLTFSFTTYLLKDIAIISDVIDIITKKVDGINHTFEITIKFNDGRSLTDNFKLVSFDSSQDIDKMPMVSLTFTN